jgi:predicted AAA+ superfamily ATPase
MLKRIAEKKLLAWKNSDSKLPLVVKGARQVGKSFIIEKFAKENYKKVISIDFIKNPKYKQIFEGDIDVETILLQLNLRVPSSDIVNGNTLIFLDEIQECPEARTALKFLARDKRFDVVASGSLLGINYKEVPSFPVGYVSHLEMHSLNFEEFLWAKDIKDNSIKEIKKYFTNKKEVPKAIHERMLELFREYIVVGGMPMAVQTFINDKNFSKVLKVQRGIIEDYADDITKYARGVDKAKIKECFYAIPKELAQDYKKFKYSIVERGGTARKFSGSLRWLYDAGIINFCNNLKSVESPLEGNSKQAEFKIYMRDTGLLMAMLEDGSQEEIIDGNFGIYKGAIYENIIADIFTKNEKKLYYYEKNNKLEIDFIIKQGRNISPIEVKSADNTKSKSLKNFLVDKNMRGIKLSTKNIGVAEKFDSFPLYMAMYL